ncbi:hypothetical protein KBC80_02805 [Candidatus Woesebacteria bacterium]|nr:hypothetical protein [Candidatus Woesebacteria bacterium]
MNKIFKKIYKHILPQHLLLAAIVLVGIFIRFYQVFNGMPWEEDAGRDLLVAKHMVEQSASWFNSPPPSGTSFLDNTPLYFWLIAILYSIGHTVSFVMTAFAFMGVVTIVLAYMLGKMLRNSFTGLLFASLVSFSYITVVPSRSILQPNLMGLLIVLTMIFYVRFHRSELFHDGLLLVICMFSGVALHLGYLPVLVFFSIALVWEVIRAQKFHKSLLIFFIYYFLLFVWALLYIKVSDFHLMVTGGAHAYDNALPQRMGLGLMSFLRYLFFGAETILKIILGEMLLGLLILKRIPGVIKSIPRPFIVSSIFWIISLLGVCAVYGDSVPYYYFDAFYVVALFGFTVLIDRIIHPGVRMILATFLLLGTSYYTYTLVFNDPNRDFISTRTVAERILSDYRRLEDQADEPYDFWVIAAEGHYPGIFGMFSEQYWYILETITGKELTKVVAGSQNSKPLVTVPKYVYVVCKIGEFNFTSNDYCLSEMASHYPHDFRKLRRIGTIAQIAAPHYNLYIHRFERPKFAD